MDLLKKELERKKKALAKASKTAASGAGGEAAASGAGGRRYLKASQLRELEAAAAEEEESNKRRANDGNEPATKKQRFSGAGAGDEEQHGRQKKESGSLGKGQGEKPHDQHATSGDSKKESLGSTGGGDDDEDNDGSLTIKKVTIRLRSMGLAVRLFGETDVDRKDRLKRALADQQKHLATLSEKDEFRLGQGHRIRNPFLEKDGSGGSASGGKAGGLKSGDGGDDNNNDDNGSDGDNKKKKKGDIDNYDITNETDPHKRIYKYFKLLLKQWEDDLVQRSDTTKRSVAGRNETKTYQQCQDYIKPLFKLCKKRKLEPGLQAHLTNIVNYCVDGEFVKAHDAYMDVAIGRAAWPIGVTMVGIHARTGRSKIESSNVAHVMNSELQRKYLTSVKRLMSYAQKKRTDVDPSKKVMN